MSTRPSAPTTADLIAAGTVADHPSPFALPRGLKGRLAGWYMSRPDAQHRELAALVALRPEMGVLEIGFGPGQMLAELARREPTLHLAGVDPSDLMVRAARLRNRRADLRIGAAAAMPFADHSADVVLSVNNAPMWPDTDDALAEIRRVLDQDGMLLVAWHGGADPRGHQRRLVLSRERFTALDDALRRAFPVVTHHPLQHSELWEARNASV